MRDPKEAAVAASGSPPSPAKVQDALKCGQARYDRIIRTIGLMRDEDSPTQRAVDAKTITLLEYELGWLSILLDVVRGASSGSTGAPDDQPTPTFHIDRLVARAKSNWCQHTHGHGMDKEAVEAIDQLAALARSPAAPLAQPTPPALPGAASSEETP